MIYEMYVARFFIVLEGIVRQSETPKNLRKRRTSIEVDSSWKMLNLGAF